MLVCSFSHKLVIRVLVLNEERLKCVGCVYDKLEREDVHQQAVSSGGCNRISLLFKYSPSVHSLFDFNEHEESFFLDATVKIAYRQ